MEKKLNENLFWLNGASSGIGFAVAEKLARHGASLILASRSLEKLQEKKKSLIKLGASTVEIVVFDVSKKIEEEKLSAILEGRKISGLLLNAGGPRSGKITSLIQEDFEQANQLLVAGPAQFLISMLKHMVPKKSSIVAITSSAVKEPVRELNLSAIYRTAFVVLLKNLASEIGETGVRINNVAPGKISTEHLSNMIKSLAQKNSTSIEDEEKVWSQCSVLNRMGTPQEAANVVSFLFSQESSFINGQTIFVDGSSTKSYF